jgi:hypothetical protein
VANGGTGDIDATQVDPASLRFDPDQASPAGSFVSTDLGANAVFSFNAFDADIACGDTELTRGKQPFMGR